MVKGPNPPSMQGDKTNHLLQSTAQQPANVSLSNSYSQDVVSHSTNFLQNYASLPQPVFNSPGYVNGGTVFSGQMIPPMVVQQPMQVPSALPGMFQTGFMYQTLPPGSGKPNHVNSHFFDPFTKGSLIMLATGSIKPIEELKTVDFIESAKVSKQLCFETSTIAKIQDHPNSAMSLIGFAVDNYESEVSHAKPGPVQTANVRAATATLTAILSAGNYRVAVSIFTIELFRPRGGVILTIFMLGKTVTLIETFFLKMKLC